MANPSGLLQGAIMMLNHLGQSSIAEKVQNAWLKTIEDVIHTYDIFKEGSSKQKVGTKEFSEAVIANLGQKPSTLKSVSYGEGRALNLPKYQKRAAGKKELLGVDLFVHWNGTDANEIAATVNKMNNDTMQLTMITNRGIKVWPEGFEETFCTDHWRCRFKPVDGKTASKEAIIDLLNASLAQGVDVIKTENLYAFDGKPAFSLGQGQ
jgi:isocitrate dehydrogenase